MTATDLKTLKLRDKVKLTEDGKAVAGAVTEVGYAGLRIVWEDGVTSNFHFNAQGKQGVLDRIERA